MWIVKLALDRPYTFIILALLILIMSPVVILRTPTDIFPNINIPVVAVAWQYTGPQSGRDGRPAHHPLREGADHAGRQHRAHRVDHLQRRRGRQDLPAARRQPGYGQRPGHRRLAIRCCASFRQEPSRRRSSTSARRACRFFSSASPARVLTEQQLERLEPELRPSPARHRARRRAAPSLWRQTAPDHASTWTRTQMQSKGVSPGDLLTRRRMRRTW